MQEPHPATTVRGLLSRNQFVALVGGIAALAIGLLVVIWTPGSLFVLRWALGSVFFFVGVSEVVEGFVIRRGADYWPLLLLRGATSAFAGALALTWPDITDLVLALIIGINLIIYGIIAIIISRQISKAFEAHSRNLWRGALALAIGIVLVAAPGRSVFVIAVVCGIYLIFFGVLLLVASYQLNKLKTGQSDMNRPKLPPD